MQLDVPTVGNRVDLSTKAANAARVPTDDERVQRLLRRLGESLDGTKEERRLRLIQIAENNPKAIYESEESESEEDEEFYTPGTQEVLKARKAILLYSMQKAPIRIERLKEAAQAGIEQTLVQRRQLNAGLAKFASKMAFTGKGNSRAFAAIQIYEDKVLCGSWDGGIYVFRKEKEELEPITVLRGHTEKVSALDIFQGLAVSGGAEGTVNLWTDFEKCHAIKNAHRGRVAKLVFHPSGDYFATTSFDYTWKLWDTKQQRELYEQEGHSKEVFAAAFHPDGSLLATGGLDSITRVFDLRSGRSIAVFGGHIQGIYGMDWSSNGYHLATASGDCTVKIWDMRKTSELYTIPAHTKLVSDVRFHSSGKFLATAGYDAKVKFWSADSWSHAATLEGHTDRVTSCALGTDYAVSCGWDKTVRVWTST